MNDSVMPATAMAKMREWHGVDRAAFRNEIMPLNQPAVLKGLVRDWPAVKAGRKSNRALADYIREFDLGRPAEICAGPPSIGGRFFYSPDMRGFNFDRRKETIGAAIEYLLARVGDADPPWIYVQSTPIPEFLPQFADANRIDLVEPGVEGRIWIGNAVNVAAHYDLSDNVACVVAGRRRFTLFPPEQLANLYVGPLDFTPAGPPVSMVDLDNPDLERFPRFVEALAAAQSAELEAGDAIYIPYFWWHQVRSLEPFNVLVNYWWNDARPAMRNPYDSLLHAVLVFRDLPENQRAAWRAAFDYYVFGGHGEPMAHLAPEHRGALAPMTPEHAAKLKTMLLRSMSNRAG